MSNLSRRRILAGTAALGGAIGVGAGGAALAAPSGTPGSRRYPPPMGPVKVVPDDPRYADLMLRGVNTRFRGTPEYVHVVGSTQQVVRAVQEAVDTSRRIAVRSGGHCFEDFVDNVDVKVVIDMSGMSDVYYDAGRRAFVVEPGATLMEAFKELYFGWGVTIPGGNCGTVGVGGHICGGGYGPLSRQLGSVVDYLDAVEVVVVDKKGRARAVIATRDEDDPNRDLWWAHTGGGGGNFGVVTRYWFRTRDAEGDDPSDQLPKPPPTILGVSVIWPWEGMSQESFERLLRNHGTWFEQNSDPDSPYAALWSVLMLGSRLPAGSEPDAHLTVAVIDGTLPDAQQLLDDYVAAVSEGVEPAPTVIPIPALPWFASVQMLNEDETTEGGGASKVKAGYLRKRLTDEQITTVYEFLGGSESESGQGGLWFVAYGGKVNTVAPEETAMPQRDSILKAVYLTGWEDPADEQRNLAWIRSFYGQVYADTGGVPVPGEVSDGSYVNYPDTDLADPALNTSGVPWHELYYKGNYARLQRVKAKYDPRDVFHHTLSVRPA